MHTRCTHSADSFFRKAEQPFFETDASLKARVRRKRKHGEAVEDDAEKVEALKATSLFALPPERRWEIITAVQRRYHALFVQYPQGELKEMDQASLARNVAERDAEFKKERAASTSTKSST
jgi:hypothetical protein